MADGFVDLHVHTTASDGRLTPTEAVRAASERGLSAIAITDHDVLWGLEEAAAAAPPGLEVVPGIEMTAAWEGPRAIHVLGYFVDPANSSLKAALSKAQRAMERHVDTVLAAIRAVGGTLERQDLDRYRHRYARRAAGVYRRRSRRAHSPGRRRRIAGPPGQNQAQPAASPGR